MIRLSLAVVLAVSLVAGVARASLVTAYDLETLVGASELAVVGRVTEVRSRYEGRRIVTDVLASVQDVGKGRARRGEQVQFLVLGGTVDGVSMRVEGSVRLRPGEEAMFFLERRAGGVLLPVGLSQGVLPVRDVNGVRTVHPGASGLSLVRRDAQGRYVAAPAALTAPEAVSRFVDRVRALAGHTP